MAQEQSRGPTTRWSHFVLSVAFVVVMGTGATFAAGVVHFSNNPPKGDYKPGAFDLLKDTTFFILLSQSLPNILASFFELMKVRYDRDSPWKDRVVFPAALVFVGGLSFAAPLVYAQGRRDTLDTWTATQVSTMILSACASLAAVIAGMLSVFEAGHEEQQRTWDEENTEGLKRRVRELERQVKSKRWRFFGIGRP